MPKFTRETRKIIENIAVKNFIYAPTASIYGGVSGLYDFGPLGCKLKANILFAWRSFFVLRENMQEVETTMLTPEVVLKASGHVEKFQDMMVRDIQSNQCFRADHLIEDHIDVLLNSPKTPKTQKSSLEGVRNNIGGMDLEEIRRELQRLGVKSPVSGGELSDPFYFNLMFSTPIGPTAKKKGYLRPETAQGIFVNFLKLLKESGGKLPFAAAQIGTSYRNEIAPRSGLLRVREFPMAEIEHFCSTDPLKKHEKFSSLTANKLNLWTKDAQRNSGEIKSMTVKEAVAEGIIANETLGYYIAKTFEFLVKIGIQSEGLRFRQHLRSEMAHYATDCWDAEIETSFGWIECVGLADRACYDLQQHSKFSKTELGVFVSHDEPKKIRRKTARANVSLIGRKLRKDSLLVLDHLRSLNDDEVDVLQRTFEESAETFIEVGDPLRKIKVEREMIIAFEEIEVVEEGYNFIPPVIEPSFGIGRILYALLEHSVRVREEPIDEEKKHSQKSYLAFNAEVAPIKCLVTPLSGNKKLIALSREIHEKLLGDDVYAQLDMSNTSVGRKYVRSDERGVMFCVTIDFDSVEDRTFTLRYRDTMEQIRLKIDGDLGVVKSLVSGEREWQSVIGKFGRI